LRRLSSSRALNRPTDPNGSFLELSKSKIRIPFFHCPQGKTHAKHSFDQLSHCLSRPEVEGKFQLIRAAIRNHLGNLRGLPGKKRSPFWPASRLDLKSFGPTFPVSVQPQVNRLPGNTKDLSNLDLLFPSRTAFTAFVRRSFWAMAGSDRLSRILMLPVSAGQTKI